MPLENFVTKVTLLEDKAQYPATMKERVIWDTLISGIFCEKTHDRITKKGGNVTLKEVKDIARVEYSTKLTINSMNDPVKANVNYLKYDRNLGKGKRKGRKFSSNLSQGASHQGTVPSKGPETSNSICSCCGKGKHSPGQKCPALEVICRICKKENHYATICQSSKSSKHGANLLENSTDPADGKSIACYEENGTLVYMAEAHMLLTVINKSFPSKGDLLMEFPIGLNCSNLNGKVLLKSYTGADMNTLVEATFKELFPRFPIDKLCPNDIELANYGNSGVNILGSIPLFIKWH